MILKGTCMNAEMQNKSVEETGSVSFPVPLLFTYRDTVFGNGFVAQVCATNGRLLCISEDDGFWMYGVNPGGMATGSTEPKSALAGFRRMFSNILVDIAAEADDFAAFQKLVTEFFNSSNPGYEAEWQDAVAKVRSEGLTVDGLKKLSAESPRSITVELKHEGFTVKDNRPEVKAKMAA